MKKIENKAMLISYADTLGGDLKQLNHVMKQYFPGAFGGLHVLPFFPSSGDRGFAVIHYDTVDPKFGSWEDIDALADRRLHAQPRLHPLRGVPGLYEERGRLSL